LVINLDLKKFFSKITTTEIANLLISIFKIDKDDAIFLALLTTYKNRLPQGATSSPLISNFYLYKMDFEIKNFLYDGIYYSRYADDLTFSTNKKNININAFVRNINSIIQNHNMTLNYDKINVYHKNKSQRVTGLIVNEKINLERKFLKKIRAILHNISKNGLEIEKNKFEREYCQKELLITLEGWINYVGFIRGYDDTLYLDFRTRYNKIYEDNNKSIK